MAKPGTVSLDDAYNARKWAPDYQRTLDTFVARGEAVLVLPDVRRGLAWGPGTRQVLDFVPSGSSRGPLALFLHGGYWQYRTATRDVGTFLAPRLAAGGCAFATATYELCPDIDMDSMVGQMDVLIDWLAHTANEAFSYHVDRVVLIGHSAGAHLASMAALSNRANELSGRLEITGVCGIGGIYDLRPLVGTQLNNALGMDSESAWRNSPLRSVRPGTPPFLVACGELESPALSGQSAAFVGACAAAGADAELIRLPKHDHYSGLAEIADGTLGDAIIALAQGR